MGPFLVAALLLVVPASAQTPVGPWEADIQRFEQADLTDLPAPGGVLFLGSSSIRMWETLAEDFPGVPVVSRGFGGSEIADSTRFAGRIVVPYRPRLIVLYAGDNDPRLSYIDVFTPILDADGKPRPELFGDDGLHLNAAGYALWVRLVKPHLSGSGRDRGGR